MLFKKSGLLLLFIICCTDFLIGQADVIICPVSFSQYYNVYEMVNPAIAGSDKYSKLSLGNKKLLGNFSKISTYYLSAYAKLEPKYNGRNKPYSVLGVYVYNDKEGKYLNRSRFYLTYAWHGFLSNNVKFSGGFHFGGMNYSVKGTDLSGSGSDIVPDGIIGVQFYNKHFHVGAAYNQIFNSQVQPLMETGSLTPYLSLTASGKIIFSDKIVFKPNVITRIPPFATKPETDISFIFEWNKKLAYVIGIHQNNIVINSFELKNLFYKEKGLNISFTYGFPLPSTSIGNNFFEFGLGYLFDI